MNKNIKDKNNPNYIDGRTLKKYYCKDCEKRISYQTGCYGKGRCKSCAIKIVNIWQKNRNKHTEKFKQKMSKLKKGIKLTKQHKRKISKNHANMKGKNNPMFGKVTHGKWGKYKGIFMRSSYETIYAKWLDHCKVKWLYESKTFDLGNTTYTPDFYLPDRDRYIEIKGYWRDDAKKKYKLFKMKYPNIKISIIIEPEIRRMERDLGLLNL